MVVALIAECISTTQFLQAPCCSPCSHFQRSGVILKHSHPTHVSLYPASANDDGL